MAITFISPIDITPGADDAWTDADVSGSVPAGATGVIIQIGQSSGGDKLHGFRCNGSTDNRVDYHIGNKGHFWIGVGVDANRVLELYVDDKTNNYVYLVGYFTSESVFFTNGVDKSIGGGAWTDIDISADTGANTAIGAIFEVDDPGATNTTGGMRKNGSTDARTGANVFRRYWGSAIIGVDGNEICEGYLGAVGPDFFLLGYIKSQATFNTNATDLSIGSTDAWTDMSALPSGAIGGILEVNGSGGNQYYGWRKNGSDEAKQGEDSRENFGIVQCDTSRIIEGWVNSLNADFFLVGYITESVNSFSGTDAIILTENFSGNYRGKLDVTEPIILSEVFNSMTQFFRNIIERIELLGILEGFENIIHITEEITLNTILVVRENFFEPIIETITNSEIYSMASIFTQSLTEQVSLIGTLVATKIKKSWDFITKNATSWTFKPKS